MSVDVTARFAALVQGPEVDLPLDEAALLMAAHGDPSVDIATELTALDALAASCPTSTLEGWRQHLFMELGYAGNALDYHDPRNSFLHEVVRRRTGIPITLGVLGMEVGRRLGLRLLGVGMPGHFLLRHESSGRMFVDPFHHGRILDVAGCEERFHELYGGEATFDQAYLSPVGPRAILGRMLNNLRRIYLTHRDTDSLAWVLRLRAAIPGTSVDDRAELGRVLASAGRYREAAVELEVLAGEEPDHAEALGREARLFRARLN